MRVSTAPGHYEHLSGTLLKGYELLERIGTGGFGAVYRALQSTIDREVAIKIILAGWSNNPEFIRRFEAEAQVIARLEHPHIVPLHDYWRDPDGAYLVMRYLRGGSVRDALREAPYDLVAASRLLDQVALALDLAHRSSIVHRDVKPGNILLDEDGNAYLGDFGIATEFTRTSPGHDAPGGVAGSLDYSAPEQVRGEPVTPQTDIYSIGVTLYEMITGRHPFPGSSSVEKLYHHINDPLPLIDGFVPATGDAINAVIQTATAKAPQKRYPDVLAFAAALREAVGRYDTTRELPVIEQLTLREHEVLQLIAQGMTNQEIANKLFVTAATVRWHIRHLYRTLGVRSRVQAIVRARELDLIATDAVASSESASGLETVISLAEPDNPYKGLRPFQVGDALDFFGREALVDKLIERMDDPHRFKRFLAIVGPSGSGKSSLVRAGLIPALWRGQLPGSERWFVVDMIPSTRPLDQLEVALTRVAANQAGNLREHLVRDANGLLRAVDLVLPRDGSELVLIIDQFEELFTLVGDESHRAHFLALLYSSVTDPRSRIRVVITLRADCYDRPLHYPEFGELVRSRMETLLPLSAQGLEQAIVGPAKRVGVMFEPGLVAQIVSEMNYQAGALPLLQYALTELFDRREGRLLTRAAYAAIGGAVGALANRAEELFYSQDAVGRELTRQMFLRLVTLGEQAGNSRRRVPRSELLSLGGDRDLIEEIIDTFAEYRLLSLDHEADTRRPIVELAHEAILHDWDRLRMWLEDSRNDISQQRLLALAAQQWIEAAKDPSYLLRGTRLEQFESWAAATSLALTPRERDFLNASSGQKQREDSQEHERQEHELTLAREAAASQCHAASRLRYLAISLAIFLVTAIALSVFAFSQRNVAVDARATSDANYMLAGLRAAQAQKLALVNGAQAALELDDIETALALAFAANGIAPSSSQAERILSEAAYRPGTVRHYEDAVLDSLRVTFSPDGKTILAGGANDVALVWDAVSGRLLYRLAGHSDWVLDVGISPDGTIGFTLGRDRQIILWDLQTGQEVRRFGPDLVLGPEALSAAFSPSGRYILSNNGGLPNNQRGEEANLILWDVATGEPVRTFRGHTGWVSGVAISPDGRLALSGAFMGEMILWDMETAAVIRRFSENSDDWRKAPSDVAFAPDGRTAYAKGMDGVLVVWDLTTFSVRHRLGEPYGSENWAWTQLAVSPTGRLLCTQIAGTDELGVWDARSGTEITRIPASAFAVAFSPDSRYLLSDDSSGMRLWDVTNGAEMRRFEVRLPVFGIALSPDGTQLFAATAAIMGSIRQPCEFYLFDVQSGDTLRRFDIAADETDELGCVIWASPVFSRDGHYVLAGVDERVIVWDTATGSRVRTFRGHSASVSSIGLSPDGRSAVSGDINGQLILWDVDSAQAIRRLRGHQRVVSDIAFNPDGHSALSSGEDGASILWDLMTGEELRRFESPNSVLDSVDMSSDGQMALSYESSGLITVWDLATGQALRSFISPLGGGTARFTRDDHGILTTNGEWWDVAASEVIRRYPPGFDLVIAPDGASFFTAVWQPVPAVIQWRLDSYGDLLAWTMNNRVVRELTCAERQIYQLDTLCDVAGQFPTRTPPPALAPTAAIRITPVVVVSGSAASAAMPTPSVTPRPTLIAYVGENWGEVAVGDYQVWQYQGRAGEVLTIRVNADLLTNREERTDSQTEFGVGMLDSWIIVTAPDGRDLNVYNSGGGMNYLPSTRDDSISEGMTGLFVDGLVLPVDGTYEITVGSSGSTTWGVYTMIIESQMP
jgi:WD40 repeat protein/serine/threonine protein kinase